MRCYDYIVAGSGIAGASIACELAEFARVLVVEREGLHGYHTTGRSAAMYIESYGNAWVRRLTVASRPFFDAPPAGFCDEALLTRRGCLTIAGQGQRSALDSLTDRVDSTGSEIHQISGGAARDMVPILKSGSVVRAAFEPNSCDIDTHGLHAGYLRSARARGATLCLNAGVERIERRGSIWRLSLAGGDLVEARVIVNAAGAWADQVAELAGAARLGLKPLRRTVVLLAAPTGMSIERWPSVVDVDEQFYFKPESGCLLATPADETLSAPVDTAPEELDIALCVDRIQSATDLSVSHIQRSWAGLRTFAPDRTPVFGYDPELAGFFWFAGQGGYGMQTAPAAARLGAALALQRTIPSDLSDRGLCAEPFSPSRWR